MNAGTAVGKAYVKVAVDGRGMNKAIAKELDDIDFGKVSKASGRKVAENMKQVNAELKKSVNVGLSDAARAMENDRQMSRAVAKTIGEAFDAGKMAPVIQRAGERAGITFGTDFDHAVNRTFLESFGRQMEKTIRKGKVDLTDFVREVETAADGMWLPGPDFDRIVAALTKLEADRQKAADKATADRIKAEEKATEAKAKAEQKITDDKAKAEQKISDDKAKAEKRIADDKAKDDAKRLRDNAAEELRLRMRAQQAKADRREKTPDRVGALFGRGSRSNTLNLLGGAVAGAIKLSRSLWSMSKRVVGAAKSIGDAFMDGFKNAAEGASTFQKVMSGMGAAGARAGALGAKALAAIAAAAPAVVAAIVVVTMVLSVLASVIGALIGVATALASTITVSLVGGLVILGGALTAVVGAAGLATIAFMSMNEEQKKLLSESMQPLVAETKAVGQAIMKEMVPAFSVWGANLKETVALLHPIAPAMGKAFADSGTIITRSLAGPGFKNLRDSFGIHLPNIIRNLSVAMGTTMNGFAGMFAALMPTVGRFAWYLADVGTRFSNWANSAKGQNAISDFMVKAEKSLKSLWGALTEFGGVLKDVLFSKEAVNAGASMFDGIKKKFKQMRDAIMKAIENGDLEKWFKDAKKFGGQLWDAVEGLYDIFTALYNSGVLANVGSGLSKFGGYAKATAAVLGPLVTIVNAAYDAVKSLTIGISGFGGFGKLVPGGVVMKGLNSLAWTLEKVAGLIDKVNSKKVNSKKPRVSAVSGDDKRTPRTSSATVSGRMMAAAAGTPTAFSAAFSGPMMAAAARTPSLEAGRSISERVGALNTPPWEVDPAPARDLPDSYGSSGSYDEYTGSLPSNKSGGKSKKGKWRNPYIKWAKSLIKHAPSMATQLQRARVQVNKAVATSLNTAGKSKSLEDTRNLLTDSMVELRDTGADKRKEAQANLNEAAARLANAKSKKEAKAALRAVNKARADLKAAQIAEAQMKKASDILNAQRVVKKENVDKLLSGAIVSNATLADYALAREKLAVQIDEANAKLTEAIQMRDDYARGVTDAMKSFGSLVSAEKRVIDGVEQSLNAGDITGNLQNKLASLQAFQQKLRLLVASGLSDAAYKQLVDAGVATGTEYADAILAGGAGAVEQINDLVGQIDLISEGIGKETSTRLYQAGVDTAQGILDGLKSLDAELEAAAKALGDMIAAEVKKALGIKSPSKVMFDMMGHVGDGIALGLGAQDRKVMTASTSLSNTLTGAIYPSPMAAQRYGYGASDKVSGNDMRPIELTVVTPTEDPTAVAHEAINELVGRL